METKRGSAPATPSPGGSNAAAAAPTVPVPTCLGGPRRCQLPASHPCGS